MKRQCPVASLVALIGSVLWLAPATAADKEHQDWPCVQKKVEEIAVSQVWDGPQIDTVKGWQDDDAVAVLVRRLANRKFTLAEAEALVKDFAESQPEASRDKRLTLVFAGFFETVASERKTILAGIEKYNRRQKERAEVLAEKGKKIAEIEDAAATDEAVAQELAKLQEDYDWETRIFKERNDSIPIACELPVLIDQRLFDLARTIRGLMKS
jgi:hypothetical protein